MIHALDDIAAAFLSNAALVVPLAVMVAIICRIIRRPAVAWGLWALVLLKFVTPAWYPLQISTAWKSSAASFSLIPISQRETRDPQSLRLAEADAAPGETWTEENRRIDHAPPSHETPDLFPSRGVEMLSSLQLAAEIRASIDATDPSDGTAKDTQPDDASTSLNSIELGTVGRSDITTDRPPAPPLPQWDEAIPESMLSSALVPPAGPLEELPLLGNASPAASTPAASTPAAGSSRGAPMLSPHVASVAITALLAVWACGSASLLVLVALRVRRFRKLLGHAQAAPAELVEAAQALAAKLGCRSVPALRITTARIPPLLWGMGRRAVIVLPQELLEQLDNEQGTAVLAHELAHFARRDHLVRWFELAVRSVYWWHPVAWLAGRKLREAEEQCCDAWVVRLLTGPDSPRRYADALLKTVDFLATTPIGGLTSPAHRAATVPPLASGITTPRIRRSVRPFHRRLTMLIHERPNPTLSWPARLCLLAIAAIILPASIAAVGEDAPTSQTDEITAKTPSNAEDSRVHEATRNAPADGDSDTTATEAVHSAPLHAPYEAEKTPAAETITVVRATYELPQKVLTALNTFIRQHSYRFEFLMSVETTPEQAGKGVGLSDLALPSPTRLTIIATPEIQQQFGDFIRAIQSSSKLSDGDATAVRTGEAAETLMVVRATYQFRPPMSSTLPPGVTGSIGFEDSARGRVTPLPPGLVKLGEAKVALGRDVFQLVTAVKEANVVPLLVTTVLNSTPDNVSFGVTTTEEFQQALGKFIRFLQEHEPKAGVELSRNDQREIYQQLSRAHEAERNAPANPAEGVHSTPLHAPSVADKESIKQATEQIQRRQEALQMTRYREAEISAKLLALKEMLKQGTVNKPAMLLAIGREEGTNPVWTMLREVADLETTRDRYRETGVAQPGFISNLQKKIDAKRQALGLPTGDEAPPVDLFNLYVKSLELQLENSRAVIKALEESEKPKLVPKGTYEAPRPRNER